MGRYDIALKNLLKRSASGILRDITGLEIAHWRNVELPDARTLSVDLLGETADGLLLQIELQSRNDPDMVLRMLEYSVKIRWELGKFPVPLVLYVGESPMRMDSSIHEPGVEFSCRMVDIREIDAESLLASGRLEDSVLAVLGRMRDAESTVRRILERIANSQPAERERAMSELATLAGLRKLGTIIKEQVKAMPILEDFIDHDWAGPIYRKGREEGREEGRTEGREEGRTEAYTDILLSQIEERFGRVDASTRARIETLDAVSARQIARRILTAPSIDELLA